MFGYSDMYRRFAPPRGLRVRFLTAQNNWQRICLGHQKSCIFAVDTEWFERLEEAEMANRQSKRWALVRRPNGAVTDKDLELQQVDLPELEKDQVLIRNLYLSLDPSNRIWMSDEEQYMPPVELGDVMRGMTFGTIEESNSDRFPVGTFVSPHIGAWEEFTITKAESVRKVKVRSEEDLPEHAGVLGPTGLTAYFGIRKIGLPKEGDTVVVSAAAGAVGSVACQIAKIDGCRVIGIAGSDKKCAWLKDELRVDGVINYKTENVGGRLDQLCPDGIDVSFENVGGEIMDAVFNRLNTFSRVVLCGLISSYNEEGPARGPTDFGRILMRRVTIRGFIASDFLTDVPEALGALSNWKREGRLQSRTHIVDGLENALDALNLLYSGKNDGKLVLRILH